MKLAQIVVAVVFLFGLRLNAQALEERKIPSGAHVFVAAMDGFETYIVAALKDKNVPVVIEANRAKADFEMTGTLFGQRGIDEQVRLKVTNLKTNLVSFAFLVDRGNSARAQQSAAEACAKRLKDYIEKSR